MKAIRTSGNLTLSSKRPHEMLTCEVLERRDRMIANPYESDADKTDEEIVVGLMEITALSLSDTLEDEPAVLQY